MSRRTEIIMELESAETIEVGGSFGPLMGPRVDITNPNGDAPPIMTPDEARGLAWRLNEVADRVEAMAETEALKAGEEGEG